MTNTRFAEAVIKASKGEKGIVEPTFVYLPGVAGGDEIAKATGLDFFSTPVELGVRLQFSSVLRQLTDNARSRSTVLRRLSTSLRV